jgi:GT2 family glycosyltransferase
MNVKASVIIVNYNGARYVEKLFSSLNMQSFRNFEIIFVDNASRDDSIKILERQLKAKKFDDLNVKIILNKQNFGFCKGNNVGFKQAIGEYIVFLNNDTYVMENWLEELVKVLDSSPLIGACQSKEMLARTGEIYSLGNLCDKYGFGGIRYYSPEETKKSILVDGFFYAGGMSTIFRKDVLDKCNGFDERLFFGDCDLCWRLRSLGYKIATAPKSVFYHYVGVATNDVLSRLSLTCYSYRERVRILLKNYSLNRVLRRLPVTVTIMFAESTVFSLWYRKPYLKMYFKAMFWNLSQLRSTLDERAIIQNSRKVPDSEIEKSMIPFSFLVYGDHLYEK